jgi:hypothetical protein
VASPLEISFLEDVTECEHRLSFGRSAELEIDDNPHLHRVMGEFVRQGDVWWIVNHGSRLFLTVVGADGSRTELPPGGQLAIADAHGSVLVTVGQARYELTYRQPSLPETASAPDPPPTSTSTRTFTEITAREVDFLVSFAKPVLDGTNGPIPSYADVASWWGVSPSTVDNTLRSLKRKLRHDRLIGDVQIETMVQAVVKHSLVTRADLEWSGLLVGEARPARQGPRFRPPGG